MSSKSHGKDINGFIRPSSTVPVKRFKRSVPSSMNMDIGAAAFILSRITQIQKVEDDIANSQREAEKDGMSKEAMEKYKVAVKRRWVKAIIIHIALILALIAYSLIGAAIFQALEYRAAEQKHIDLITAKSQLMDRLWESKNINQTDKESWLELFDTLLTDYDNQIVEASAHGIDVSNKTQHRRNVTVGDFQDWNFFNSLFFAGTIYTTIGYGHFAPMTKAGKVVTMIYAILGIPLCLIVLADMGGLLGEFIKFVMRRMKKCYYSRRLNSSLDSTRMSEEEVATLKGSSVLLCLVLICIVYLFAGAAIYIAWEEWSYLESFYFLFISFSTIGLGDITPKHPKYFLLTFIYIFFGMALLSTGLTLMQQILQSSINRATDHLDAKLRFDASSEDVREEVNLVRMDHRPDNTMPDVQS